MWVLSLLDIELSMYLIAEIKAAALFCFIGFLGITFSIHLFTAVLCLDLCVCCQ